MAALAGYVARSPAHSSDAPSISADVSELALDYWPTGASLAAPILAGALVSALPVSVVSRNLAGSIAHAYSDDYYHRIHLLGGPIAAGNISTPQVFTRDLWNAHLAPKALASMEVPEAVSVAPAAPLTLQATEQTTFTITVEAEGPPRLDDDLEFTWTAAESLPIHLSGTRVLSWTFPPDWSDGIRERLEWKTDVIGLADAAEQRASARIGARRNFEFSVFAEGQARRLLEAMLWSSAVKAWAMPLWQDTRAMTAAVAAGSGALPVSTADAEFTAGTEVVVLGNDPRTYESLAIAEVTPTHLLLVGDTTMDWPQGTRVIPTRMAMLTGVQRLRRFTGDANHPFRVAFELLDPWDGTPEPSPVMYRDAPVLELPPEWGSGLEAELARDLEELDAQVGGWIVRDRTGLPTVSQRMGWVFDTAAKRQAWLRLLALLRGRQRAVWVPTWTDDLRLVASTASGSNVLTVAWAGYSEHLAGEPGREDIRLQLHDGTIIRRRITDAVEVSSAVEQLTLDATLGVDVAPSQVALVSFMALCRNSSDAAELSHWTSEVSRASATFRSFRP